MAYTWVPPSLLPAFVPWLAILLLFAIRGNRCAQAWWVFAVLCLAAAPLFFLRAGISSLNSSEFEMFGSMVGGLIFGLAALWLLSHVLAWKHRMLAFLVCLVTLASFGSLTFIMDHASDSMGLEVTYGLIALLIANLSLAGGLTLCGLACRRRYGPVRVGLFSLLGVGLMWLLILVPIFTIVAITQGGNLPVLEFTGGMGILILITWGSLLPFLLLSFINHYHRARLQALLHLGSPPAPPVVEQKEPAPTSEVAV